MILIFNYEELDSLFYLSKLMFHPAMNLLQFSSTGKF